MADGVLLGKARAVRFSERAMLVSLEEHGGRELWVPLSQVHDDSEVFDKSHDEGKLIVTAWFAEKEGLD